MKGYSGQELWFNLFWSKLGSAGGYLERGAFFFPRNGKKKKKKKKKIKINKKKNKKKKKKKS
jgi:hypothetical protein